MLEGAARVGQVREPLLLGGRPEGVHIEANELAFLAVAVALEGSDLVERHAQVGGAKGLVLIELQAVLVVQVQRPELAERHCEIDFIGRIETGEDGVGRLDDAAHSLGILGELGDGQRVPGGGQVGVVHGLVGLWLDGQADLLVVLEHRVEGLDQQFGGARS